MLPGSPLAAAEHHVDDPVRQARLGKQPGEGKSCCGASSEGFQTMVLPVTRAGTIFQLGTATGKLPAIMIPTRLCYNPLAYVR